MRLVVVLTVATLFALPCVARAQCTPSYVASDDLRWASPSQRMLAHVGRDVERMERTTMRDAPATPTSTSRASRSVYAAEAWRETARFASSPARAMWIRHRAETDLLELLAEQESELALFTLAAVQSDDGRVLAAERTLERMLALAPRGAFAPFAWARLGDHALDRGDAITALAHYGRALATAPGLLRAYVLYRRAWASRARGDADADARDFEGAAAAVRSAPQTLDRDPLARAIERDRALTCR
ncbi:tetratricopeptide repeat protein [Sandaracinus amylolyticus]|uniref:Uncharacterized protein n=1 Tax=Sandaracinus amylolyticus TaxID=927083 RepID=A0A0F6SF22_9BACT|nr:hypothetical protein [Sandaracinus amylolyticus]AKF06189.1 hypothetical protein DB32_003338 [Sandaracinus amylolyticus]